MEAVIQPRIGIEIADLGVRIAVAIASDASGQPERVMHARFDAPPTPDEALARIEALCASAITPSSAVLGRVGVAVWGGVNSAAGEISDVRYSSAWAGFPFARALTERLLAPVALTTGVHAAARAEALVGSGAGQSPMLYVHLGRSVSSAFVVDGTPIAGAHGAEGRLGHWQTGMDGPRCQCGAYGHLEPLASAQSLVRLAIGAAADDDETLAAIHRMTGVRAEAMTAAQVVALARDGARPLRELVDHVVAALASALSNLVVTLDPALIVIGGPLALADGVFFDWLSQQVAARLDGVAEPPPIRPATTEPRGALIGALIGALAV